VVLVTVISGDCCARPRSSSGYLRRTPYSNRIRSDISLFSLSLITVRALYILLRLGHFAEISLSSTMWPFSSSGSGQISASPEAGPSTSFPTPVAPEVTVRSSTPASPEPEVVVTREETPKSRWGRTIEDELAYQARIYPTTDELPGCMSIMYVLTRSPVPLLHLSLRTFHALYQSGIDDHERLAFDMLHSQR
jgi:hypothetical protein